jgi:hypothetical protein
MELELHGDSLALVDVSNTTLVVATIEETVDAERSNLLAREAERSCPRGVNEGYYVSSMKTRQHQ